MDKDNPLFYQQIIEKIIKEQKNVIGPIAVERAKKVKGISFDTVNHIRLLGNAKNILSELVSEYEKLFGKASIEVCKDAIKESGADIPQDELPEILRY